MQCIVQDMQKSAPPPLLPLLRSRLQAEVLTLVLLNPDREWTLTELASRVGAAVSSVQREIVRAERAGSNGLQASREDPARQGGTVAADGAADRTAAAFLRPSSGSRRRARRRARYRERVPIRYPGLPGMPDRRVIRLLTWMSLSSARLIVTRWMMRLSVRELALPVKSM